VTKNYYAEIDGKQIAYHSATEFLVQVGYKTGSYKTNYRVVGDFAKAWFLFRAINVGRGYKKRLVMPNGTLRPVLARVIS